jgi:hypothetical protein
MQRRSGLDPQQRRRDQLEASQPVEAQRRRDRGGRDARVDDELQRPWRDSATAATQLGTGVPSSKCFHSSGSSRVGYVASRDELLADLVIDAWEGLAGDIERAAEHNAGVSAGQRLEAIGLAYRAWATAQPHRYRLAIQTRLGSGELAPERVIPAAQRAMAVILDAIEALPKTRTKPRAELPPELRAQLATWTQRVGGQKRAPVILLRGVLFWSRLHGLISLELDGHLASMQLDPQLLYRAELAELGGA